MPGAGTRPRHAPLALALPRPHALQLGRGPVRPRAARVRRRQAPAASAGLPPLRRRWAACSTPRSAIPRWPTWRSRCSSAPAPTFVALLAGAPALRSRHRAGGRVAAGGQPALLVLRLGGAHLRRRGVRRVGRGLVRLRALGGSARHLYWGALALGLTGGMRQSVLLLLLPLWLGCALRRRPLAARAWRWRAAILVASVLAWLVPMVWLSGGPAAYLAASHAALRLGGLPDLGARRLARGHARPGRATCSSPRWSGSARSAWWRCALPVYARRVGWGAPELVPARVDAAAGDLLHARALRPGGLRADLPARARDPAVPGCSCWAVAAGSERLRRPNWRWALTAAAVLPLVLVNTGFFVSARPLPREFEHRAGGRSVDLAGARRVPRLDHEPHRGRAARARGGDPHLRRDHPRPSTSPPTPRSSPSWAIRARTRGCATRCSTCRSTRSTRCRSARCPPGFYAPQSSADHDPHAGLDIRLPAEIRSGSSGSWTTGTRRRRGPTACGRSSSRTAAISTSCRSAARPPSTPATPSSAPPGEGPDARPSPPRSPRSALGDRASFLLRTRRASRACSACEAFPLDDSWIHLQFARNLAEGRGFSYNPGVPVSGSTAPLWTLALGGGVRGVRQPPGRWRRRWGSPPRSATAWLAGRLALVWAARHDVAVLASVLVAAGRADGVGRALRHGGHAGRAAGDGRARCCTRAGRAWAAGAALGLAALARPEAALLLPLFWLAGPLTGRRAAGVGLFRSPGSWRPGSPSTWPRPGPRCPATAAAKIEGGLARLSRGRARAARARRCCGGRGSSRRNGCAGCGGWTRCCRSCCCPGSGGSGGTSAAPRWRPPPCSCSIRSRWPCSRPTAAPSFQEGRYSIHLLPLALVVAVVPLTPLFSSSTLSPGGERAG